VVRKAWTEERFSHEGKYFQFHDVCLMPKPYQKPHPPIRVAATTDETYPMVGRMGLPIFLAVRTTPIAELVRSIGGYHEAWKKAGHPGRGEVALIVPVYVAETAAAAREEPRASILHFFQDVGRALQERAGSTGRAEVGERLMKMPYEEILKEYAVYGTPEAVVDRLLELRDALGYSSLSVWMNAGGQLPYERVMRSMRLFADRVMPRVA
jgi:alkanesulfonate monooxygenase SsuD/methylene tetrahydromethanopterin reductase-like flavin-dependent oxidoreductase (luciferase family)